MLKLAWRNIWRNRRRSSLTIASMGFGLAAVMMAQSLMKTIQAQMIAKSTGVMSGHLQVQPMGVRDPKLPDKTLARPMALEKELREDPRVQEVSARLLYTGLIFSAAGSRGVLVAGVEPRTEAHLSLIPSYLTQGRYFGAGPRDLVLGDTLASDLDVRIGEKLVLMAQSKSGEMSSELFRVAGIYHSGSETYDGQIVYIPIEAASRMRGEPGRISYLVARLKDFRRAREIRGELAARAGAQGARALTYEEVGPEIVAIQNFEDAVLTVVLLIVFSIVGLGILNTVSMSLLERLREFGVLRAIGARRGLVLRLIAAESLLLGVFGSLFGLAAGGAIIGYFGAMGLHLPVGKALSYFMPFDTVIYLRPHWPTHLKALAALAGVSLAASLGPALRAARMGVAQALRHV